MYNLNYAPTILGVQSSRENISEGTVKKKVEYRLYRASDGSLGPLVHYSTITRNSVPESEVVGRVADSSFAFTVAVNNGSLFTLHPHAFMAYFVLCIGYSMQQFYRSFLFLVAEEIIKSDDSDIFWSPFKPTSSKSLNSGRGQGKNAGQNKDVKIGN